MADNINSFICEVNDNIQELLNETGTPVQAFTKYVLDEIAEQTNIGESELCYAVCRATDGKTLGEINAYAISFNGETISLFYTIFKPQTPEGVDAVKAEEYKQAVARLQGFYDRSVKGLYMNLEPSAQHYDICRYIYEHESTICNVKLFVLSNGTINPSDKEPKKRLRDKHLDFPTWDINKLYINSNSPSDHESIDIDLINDDEFRFPLPYIEMETQKDNYQCMLAMVPGQLLYNLYENFNTNLLQNNVRFFLGFKGKKSINIEMLDTLRKQPQRFLAYNNGITATAQQVTVNKACKVITGIQDFQILNGGQTTASIFYSKQLERADKPETAVDLSQVYVQMKLIILRENVREIISQITLYSNSQNKVKTADYSTNNEFNLKLQEISRSHYAPDRMNNGNLTQWYYERVRGQYEADLKNRPNAAAKEYFVRVHPKEQLFKKELLAKVWQAWNQFPYYVCLGDQGNYKQFISNIESNNILPDEVYFEDSIALIILFDYMNKKSAVFHEFHQIKAQMIGYSFAMLNYLTSSRISLFKIWREQTVPDSLKSFIDSLALSLYDQMNADKAVNVTFRDYCKSKNTWETVKRFVFNLDFESISDCYKLPNEDNQRVDANSIHISKEDHDYISGFGSKFWSGLSSGAFDFVSTREREIATDITSCLMNERLLSNRLIETGKIIIDHFLSSGISIDEIKEKSALLTDKKENKTFDIHAKILRLTSNDWAALKVLVGRTCDERHAKALIKVANMADKASAKTALLILVDEAIDAIEKKFNRKF